jgi:putative ubiquitin-RnfH superfamily antitoxin RatB of RatAB toxin-antitoxin module
MTETELIEIEVACALPDKQVIRTLRVPVGTTARQALLRSELEKELTAGSIDIQTAALGVFGRVVADSYELRAGERVEVYRPLRRDPREARRLRAAAESKKNA